MFDIYEQYGIIEPLKNRGETEGLVELLKSDREISRDVRDAMIAFAENPPKRPRGRPKEERSDLKLIRICQTFFKYNTIGKLPVDDSLEKMAPEFSMSVGTLKELIYSPTGKAFRKTLSKMP